MIARRVQSRWRPLTIPIMPRATNESTVTCLCRTLPFSCVLSRFLALHVYFPYSQLP